MRFKAAVIISVILHVSLFALAIFMPEASRSNETIYRVDLVSMGGGGSGGAAKTSGQMVQEPQRMKDLTTQKEEPKSKLRYKVDKKKQSKKKPAAEKKSLIQVQKKKPVKKDSNPVSVSRKDNLGSNEVSTSISAGGGGGSGGGIGGGSGAGFGTGNGIGNFPYAYYISALRSKISSSWYNALVSPGLRGKHVVVVYFKIMRTGHIKDLELRQKSGIQTLDLSAYRAVENASPFPPLPNQFTDRYLGVYFEFIWEKK